MKTTNNARPLNREQATSRYNVLMHLINVGAYSENDPDGLVDGSYWYDDMNISEEVDQLDERADAEGLRFVYDEDQKTYRLEEHVTVKVACEECGKLFEPEYGYFEADQPEEHIIGYSYCAKCCHW